MPVPTAGALPPSLMGQAPAGASPIAAPTGNPGEMAAGLSEVRAAIDTLQKALPKLQIGSEPHKAVLNAINSLGKWIPPSAMQPKAQEVTARGLLQDAQKSSMMDLVQGSLGGAGSTGAPPPGAAPGGGAPAPM